MDLDTSFGRWLRARRRALDLTQDDLARRAGCAVITIQKLEADERRPSRLLAERLADSVLVEAEQRAGIIRLARAEPYRDSTAAEAAERSSTILPTTLPTPLTSLIGRTEEVNRLCNRLTGHRGRLLTLMGPPGVGKTSLAITMAARLQNHYRDGAVFVALAEITDPMLVASAIVAALGSSDAGPKAPQIRLIESLRRKSMLLVLDNCEQIQDAAPFVAELLAECAEITILATSRERFHLRAEQRYQVSPLELAAAVELFTQRTTAVNGSFELTSTNRPTVEAICERLDRLPLALELCASQMDLLTLPQLLAQLQERRLDLLEDGARDLPARQRTLRRAIQSSYALLSEEERALFRSLSVFVGGFDLWAVAMVGSSSLESGIGWQAVGLHPTLHALIGKSLVRVETTKSGEQRFLLLETLREYALEQLRAQAEEAEMRRRHFLVYLQLFRGGDSYLRGPEVAIWAARLEAEQDNLRAALQWAFQEAHYTDMAWLLIAAEYFWSLKGYGYEWARWKTQQLPQRQTLPSDLRLAILSNFYSPAGNVDGFPSAAPEAAEIDELMEICPYKQIHATVWFSLAWNSSDPAQSTMLLARALRLSQEAEEGPTLGAEFCLYADNDYCLAAIQWGFGGFLIDQGEIAEATALITDSLQRFRNRGNQLCIGHCLGTLGELALLRGDISDAYTFLQEVATIGTTHNLPAIQAYWQPLLGIVTLYDGNFAEARRLLEQSIRFCLEVKNDTFLARTYMCMAELALWEGDAAQTEHWLGQSLAYETSPLRNTIDELQWLFVAARLATMQGNYWRAATILGLAEAEHRRIHYVYAGPMLPLVNAASTTVREKLGAELFEEAFSTGQHLSYREAYSASPMPP